MKKQKKAAHDQESSDLEHLCNKANTTIVKPPLKVEAALLAFQKRKTMNTFEANAEYGDSCLHSTVCDAKKYGITFARKPESVTNRIGRKVRVMRYSPDDPEKMNLVILRLQKARGLEVTA